MATDENDETTQVLTAWLTALTTELGVAGLEVDQDAILALAGTAAHAVVRPAAPLTTFVVGYVAGLAAAVEGAPGEAASDAVARATSAAESLALRYAT